MRVGGFGGGAIKPDGFGGGAMRVEGAGVLGVFSAVGGGTPGILGGCDAWLSSSCPESVNVGTPSFGAAATAFGVVSGSVCGLRMAGGESGGGLTVLIVSFPGTESASGLLAPCSVPVFSCDSGSDAGGPRLGAWRQKPKKDCSHCGRRKQKSTAEATIKDIPRSAIAHAICSPATSGWNAVQMGFGSIAASGSNALWNERVARWSERNQDPTPSTYCLSC